MGCDWSCDDRQQHKNVVTWDFAGGWRSEVWLTGGRGGRRGWCWANNGLKTWRKVKGLSVTAKTIHQNVFLAKGQDRIRKCMRNHLREGGLEGGKMLEITKMHFFWAVLKFGYFTVTFGSRT